MNQEKTGTNNYFYDTYALYTIAKGEKNYEEYANKEIITSLMNVYELYYSLIKEGQTDLAEKFFNRLVSSCLEINPEILKRAAHFRKENIKLKLSYIDCLGFALAESNKLKFLTGDEGFREVKGVLFVK